MTEPAKHAERRFSRRAELSAETRQILIDIARRRFTEDGYADTPIEPIVTEAGLTRGALYHHFDSKEDLFRAVFEDVEKDLVERVAKDAEKHYDGTVWSVIEAGIDAFLRAAVDDPAVRRIVFVDGPAVLGWQRWREIDNQYTYGVMRDACQHAIDAGELADHDADVLASHLLAVLCEAALQIGQASKPKAEMKRQRDTVVHIFNSLRTTSKKAAQRTAKGAKRAAKVARKAVK